MHKLKKYPYKLMAKYPGMRPKDVVIWDEYIHKNPDTFLEVWYDVHIGDPVSGHTSKDDMVASGAFDVSRWCVDVVARTKSNIYIIEIKPEARAGALGQALAYKALLVEEGQVTKEAAAAVLTDEVQPITRRAAELLGVLLFVP